MDANVHQLELDELQRRLAAWERQYGLASAECEQRYFNGEMGNSQDIIRWIHDYHFVQDPPQEPETSEGRQCVKAIDDYFSSLHLAHHGR